MRTCLSAAALGAGDLDGGGDAREVSNAGDLDGGGGGDAREVSNAGGDDDAREISNASLAAEGAACITDTLKARARRNG